MKITFGNIAVNLFVTVFGGLLLILATNYLHLGSNEQPTLARPQIDMISTSVGVPKAVKGFYTPSDIGVKPDNPNLATMSTVLDFLSSGFTVIEYQVINRSEKLQRDIELRIPKNVGYVFAGRDGASLDLTKPQHFNLEPNSQMRFVTVQLYESERLAIALGSDFFEPIDSKDYTAALASAKAVNRVEEDNFLIPVYIFWPLLSILSAITPVLLPMAWKPKVAKAIQSSTSAVEIPKPAAKISTKDP